MARKQLVNRIEKARREEQKAEKLKELEDEKKAAEAKEGQEPQTDEKVEEAEVEEEAAPKKGKGKAEEVEEKKPVKDLELPKYAAHVKPKLTKEVKTALKYRAFKKNKEPHFIRQEGHRYSKLGDKWRKPRGMHSKMRQHWGYRVNVVSIGYRGPKAARGLHPSGFKPVHVHNVMDLEKIDPKTEAIMIASTVGSKKRGAIEDRIKELEKKKDVQYYLLNPLKTYDMVTVYQPSDLEAMDRSIQAAVISPAVGKQMKKAIIKKAKELGETGKGKVRILNARKEMGE